MSGDVEPEVKEFFMPPPRRQHCPEALCFQVGRPSPQLTVIFKKRREGISLNLAHWLTCYHSENGGNSNLFALGQVQVWIEIIQVSKWDISSFTIEKWKINDRDDEEIILFFLWWVDSQNPGVFCGWCRRVKMVSKPRMIMCVDWESLPPLISPL